MLRVGLTGDLGSGKSTVAAMLAARGAVVLARAGNAVEDEGEQGVVRTYDTPHAFAAVLTEVIDDWDTLSARLREQSERFRRANTADRYVAALNALRYRDSSARRRISRSLSFLRMVTGGS